MSSNRQRFKRQMRHHRRSVDSILRAAYLPVIVARLLAPSPLMQFVDRDRRRRIAYTHWEKEARRAR